MYVCTAVYMDSLEPIHAQPQMNFLASCFGGDDNRKEQLPSNVLKNLMPPTDSTKPAKNKLRHPSDEEILHFENELKREQAQAAPLISPALPLALLLQDEYQDSQAMREKLVRLQEQHAFEFIRRCRRDGSCFYRAVAFGLITSLKQLQLPHSVLKEEWDARLKEAAYEPIIYEDFSECFWAYVSGNPDAEIDSMWQADEYSSDMAIMYLRLLTSAEMRLNVDSYIAFIEDVGSEGFAKWCERNIDAVGVDADQLQVIALGRALNLPIVIANVGGNESADDLQINEFPVNHDKFKLEAVYLLYRPGHYDLLLKQ